MNVSLNEEEGLVSPTVAPETAPPVEQVGAQLKAAREAAGLKVSELARLLRLGERQIEALEQGNWSSLPGSTFVRGFVRNYARAVQLDPTPLLAQLEGETKLEAPNLEMPASTHVTMPGQGRALNKDVLTVAAGLVLVLGAVAAYFFMPDEFWIQKPPAEAAVAVEAQPAPVPALAPAPGEPLFPPAESQGAVTGGGQEVAPVTPKPLEMKPEASAPAPASSQVVPAQPVTPAVALPAAPAVPAAAVAPAVVPMATGGVTASFSFARDSWVEVRDKDNNLIVSRLHQAGSTRDISGAPPLSIVVGNASHVKLQYKGKDVPLQPNAESDVARLTLP